jgi:hypothetical protein
VNVGGRPVPGGLVLGGVALVAFAAGYLVRGAASHDATSSAPRSPASAPLAASSAPVVAGSTEDASSAAPSAAPPPSVDAIDRARLKTLESRAARERSIDESAELARGHQRLGLVDIAAIGDELDRGGPAELRWLARTREIAKDDALAVGMLAVVARHPSREHADLLYDVRTDAHASDAVRYLAEDLLAIPAVRGKASKELVITLDLSAARGCDAVRLVVGRAKAAGDERAVPGLRALDDKSGCGPKRDEDCYPCLRDSTLLYEAHEAAAGRSFNPPWRLPPR